MESKNIKCVKCVKCTYCTHISKSINSNKSHLKLKHPFFYNIYIKNIENIDKYNNDNKILDVNQITNMTLPYMTLPYMNMFMSYNLMSHTSTLQSSLYSTLHSIYTKNDDLEIDNLEVFANIALHYHKICI